MLRADSFLKEVFMNTWTFIVEHLNDSVVGVCVLVFAAIVVGVILKKVADQPYFAYFGGGKRRESLEEHYIHGEMTTEEYEDRKSHIVRAH
jgi:uncharacterized membrane protein